jgi:hypothetical protein
MNTDMLRRTTRTIALAVCLALAYQGSAHALAIFTYTGQTYTNYIGTAPTYDASMSVSGSFMLTDPTDPGTLTGSWSFFDGLNTISDADQDATLTIDPLVWDFSIADNSLNAWLIELVIPTGTSATAREFMRTASVPSATDDCTVANNMFDCAESGGRSAGVLGFAPLLGSWTIDIETTSVPEPSALLLFATGLLGLGYVNRRRPTA